MTLLQRLAHTSPRGLDVALLILRAGFGLSLAFAHGLGKVGDLAKFTAGVAARGIPMPGVLAPAAALSEFLGGILLALGLLTRPAALFVFVTLCVAAFHVHGGDPFRKKELALAFALVALAVMLAGPGRFSLDAKLFPAAKKK